MSQTQLLEQGKLVYTNKNYDEAVQICTRILSTSRGSSEPQLKALDLRCQAYSKLGKYDLAKHDARNMIHLSKRKAPEGYIRCSQIERLSGDYAASIKWLEHGSKNVPSHRVHFENQIRRIQDLERRQIVDGKRQDPIASVPLEVLQLIISYFDYRQVVILLRVSRTWKNVICRLQPLITTIDFTGARRRVSYLGCSAAFRRLCKQPQTLILPSLSQSAKNMVQLWLSKSTNLEHLETLHLQDTDISLNAMRLKNLRKIKSLRMDQTPVIDFETCMHVTATCHFLKDMSLFNTSNYRPPAVENTVPTGLQHLRLCGQSSSKFFLSDPFFSTYLNLRSLYIQSVWFQPGFLDFSQHQHLQSLHFEALSGTLELILPPSLQDLSCTGGCEGRHRAMLILSEPVNLPNLSTMVLEGIWAPAALRALENSREPPVLNHVGLYNMPRTICENVPNEGYSILKACQKLSFHSEELRTEDSSAFAILFPNVESLKLEAPQINGVFISDLLHKIKCQIKEVKLRGCEKVSSDIRPWLASKNIECQILRTTSSDFKDARRILDV